MNFHPITFIRRNPFCFLLLILGFVSFFVIFCLEEK